MGSLEAGYIVGGVFLSTCSSFCILAGCVGWGPLQALLIAAAGTPRSSLMKRPLS